MSKDFFKKCAFFDEFIRFLLEQNESYLKIPPCFNFLGKSPYSEMAFIHLKVYPDQAGADASLTPSITWTIFLFGFHLENPTLAEMFPKCLLRS